MRDLLSFSVGVLVSLVIAIWMFAHNQLQVNLAVAQAQGRVDVMQQFCKPMLEDAGLIKKGK